MNENLVVDGGLTVRLTLADGAIHRVTIASARMTRVSRLFVDRDVGDVLAWIPRIFSLCATAQAAAAVAAVEAALAIPAHPRRSAARHALVTAETAQEHLWRVLLEWPLYLNEQPATATAAAARRILPSLRAALDPASNLFTFDGSPEPVNRAAIDAAARNLEALLEQAVCGLPPAEWLALDAAGFVSWWQRSQALAARIIAWVMDSGHAATGRVDAAFLPELDTGRLTEILRGAAAEAFTAQPTWSGSTCETTPLSRQYDNPLVAMAVAAHGHGLLARLVARLVELARVPAQLREPMLNTQREKTAPAEYCGLAQIEAARGRLIHFVETEKRRVSRYHIVAPTEWNFHPDGVVARAMTGLAVAGPETAVTRAELFIHAVDPCVRCAIEVREAT